MARRLPSEAALEDVRGKMRVLIAGDEGSGSFTPGANPVHASRRPVVLIADEGGAARSALP